MLRTLCTLHITLDWYRAFPHRCGTFLGFQSFIRLIECSFPIGLKDLTYIFVIFIVQLRLIRCLRLHSESVTELRIKSWGSDFHVSTLSFRSILMSNLK